MKSDVARRHFGTLLAMLMVLLALVTAGACTSAEPTTTIPVATDDPPTDHTSFDTLLQKHVSVGEVDYQGFQQDVAELDRYLKGLATINLKGASRAERLAFYINAYNAATIRMILRHLDRIDSIRDIDSPWDTREWILAGELLTLNDIEHTKLRKDLQEPRIHFGIVCASIGCPDLAGRAYTAEAIDDELDEAARKFMRSPRHLRTAYGDRKPVLFLSKIFKWFSEDFTEGGRLPVSDFVVRYSDPQTVAFIKEHAGRLKIDYMDYDWKLNMKKDME